MFIWLKLPAAISADIGLDHGLGAPAKSVLFCPLRLAAVVSTPSPT
jgi:hypothetical protein